MTVQKAIAAVREVLCEYNCEDLVATPLHWRLAGLLEESVRAAVMSETKGAQQTT